MSGISEVLSTQVIPWIQHTATIGVVAAGAFWMLNQVTRIWREQPMIEDDFFVSDGMGHLRLTVYNRAMAPLSILSVDAITPKNMEIIRNGAQAGSASEQWGAALLPFTPGSSMLPEARELFFIRMPAGQSKGRLCVTFRARNQRLIKPAIVSIRM